MFRRLNYFPVSLGMTSAEEHVNIYYAHIKPVPQGIQSIHPNTIVVWHKKLQITNDPVLYPICIMSIISIIAAHLAELDPGSQPVICNQPSSAPNNVNPAFVKETVCNFGLYTGYKPAFMHVFNYPCSYMDKIWTKHDEIAKYPLDAPLCDLSSPTVLQPYVHGVPHTIENVFEF